MEKYSKGPIEERGYRPSEARASEPRESTRRQQEGEDEEFELKSKAVRLPTDDIRTILYEMTKKFEGSVSIVEAVVDPMHDTSETFAKNKKVDKLYTFIGKKNPGLIEKLERFPNIVAIEDSFNYTPSDVKNPFILFFYPYWLMSMDKKAAKNVYFKNIPLQSGTFDDILRIEQPDLFAFVIPESVSVPDVYGEKKEFELEKGKLVLIVPKQKKKGPDIYGKSSGKRIEKDYDSGLVKFLKDILSPIAKEETIQKIVNTSTLPMWKKAFTHETIDLNDNYEQLETIGDRVLELTFLKYLLRKFPDLTPQEITELKSKYMSKIYQGTTSRKLGFGDWIRVGSDISSISILEDVFESFFGALFEISDRELGDGAGYVMALKFLALIFSDVEIDLSKSQGHPRSQIKEIFEMLKLDSEIQDVTTTDKGTYVEISISKRTLDDLVQMEMMKPDSPLVIGVGFGPYKTNAVNLAYSNALQYLESLGITREWAEQQKGFIDLLIPELQDYLDPAFDRMQKEGLERIYLRTSRTSVKAGNVVIQLVGEYFDEAKKKTQKKILVSGKYPDTQQGKIDVVIQYAQGK
jgi:dsRNA-specific ribonuclease